MKVNPNQCPLCGQGTLEQLTLMDVWGCQECRHLFEWNTNKQMLKVIDLSPTILWWWNGRFWQRGQNSFLPLTPGLVMGAIALASLPSLLLGIANYIFPPLPGSPFAWFPIVWQGLALVSHGACIGWVMAESYQFSPYLRFKIWLRRRFSA